MATIGGPLPGSIILLAAVVLTLGACGDDAGGGSAPVVAATVATEATVPTTGSAEPGSGALTASAGSDGAADDAETADGLGGAAADGTRSEIETGDGTEPAETGARADAVEEPAFDPCVVHRRDGIATGHWFPTTEGGDAVDPQADIYLHLPSDDEALATSAVLVASTDTGDEVRLPLAPGVGPTCRGDRFFDLPLGDAEALAALDPPFTVVFDLDDGAWFTDPVRWPDDFPRTVPFGTVDLDAAPRADGEVGG